VLSHSVWLRFRKSQHRVPAEWICQKFVSFSPNDFWSFPIWMSRTPPRNFLIYPILFSLWWRHSDCEKDPSKPGDIYMRNTDCAHLIGMWILHDILNFDYARALTQNLWLRWRLEEQLMQQCGKIYTTYNPSAIFAFLIRHWTSFFYLSRCIYMHMT